MVSNNNTTLTNVRYFDGNKLTDPSVIVINGTLISEIRKHSNGETFNGNTVDCTNKTLLPGLIDCHVHLLTSNDLHALATFGVTTALDMACWPSTRLSSLRTQSIPGTCSFQSAGLPATVAGSIHSCILPFSQDDLIKSPGDAASFVSKRKEEGSDYIKLIADVPGPSQPMLTDLTNEAHQAGFKVIAHASSSRPFIMALDAGVDIVTHAPRDVAISEETALRMVKQKVTGVPTLTMMQGLSQPPSWTSVMGILTKPKAVIAIAKARRATPAIMTYENARESVTNMHKAGVIILAGTDANAEKGTPCQILHGSSLHRELELLMEAGMSHIEVLRATTSEAAKAFNLNDRGVIEIGKRADLLLVKGNPLDDITATKNIDTVWCQGIVVE